MRMFKKISVLFLTILLCAFCSSYATAAHHDGYYIFEFEEGYSIITGVDVNINGKITVPQRLGGSVVTKITDNAFKDCSALVSVSIHERVKFIADSAFVGCTELKEFIVSENNAEYSTVSGILFNKDKSAIIKYPADYSGEVFTADKNITGINNYAFSDCNNLERLIVLNEECVIYDSEFTIASDVIICAPKNSAAQSYALKYGRAFEIYCLHTDARQVAAVEPTCEKSGYTAGVYCDYCEKYIEGREKIAATGHNWDDGKTKAVSTCTTKGYIQYTCLNDSAHKFSEPLRLNSENHEGGTYIGNKKDPTCTVKGYTGDICCVGCNKVISSGSSINALGHEIITRKSNGNGTHTGSCTREGCNYTKTDNCSYYEWNVTKNPTCTKNGTQQRKCKTCSYVDSKSIEKLGHVSGKAVTENTVNATCNKKGRYDEVVYCKTCNNQMSRKTIETPAKKHTYKLASTKSASIGTDGKFTYKCSCGSSYSKKINKISSVTLSCTEYTYNGKNKTPQLTVKDSKGKALIKNKDYKIIMPSTRNAVGKYTVKVNFTGNYSGTKNLYFYIRPAQVKNLKVSSYKSTSIVLGWSKVSGASGYKVYRYDSLKKSYILAGTTSATKFTVSKLKNATSYKFRVRAYGKNKDGKTFDSKSYGAITAKTCTASLKLRLATTAEGRATIAWNDVSGETGYQVFYASKKNGEYKKISNYKAGTVKVYKTGLTSKKTYFFKVRTYIKTDNGYVYSPFSEIKSIKIK